MFFTKVSNCEYKNNFLKFSKKTFFRLITRKITTNSSTPPQCPVGNFVKTTFIFRGLQSGTPLPYLKLTVSEKGVNISPHSR